MSDQLTDILNKCEALIDCGFTSVTSLARDIGEDQPRVTEWVTATNRSEPRGSVAFKLQAWLAKKTLQMANKDQKTQQSYRDAYKAVCRKRGRD